jgi:hypothetical protein
VYVCVDSFTNVVAAFGKLKASRRDRSVSRSCFWCICTSTASVDHSFVLFRIPARQDRSAAVEIGLTIVVVVVAVVNQQQSINQVINRSINQAQAINRSIHPP